MFRVIKFGGSLGDNHEPVDFPTKKEAKKYAKSWKKAYGSSVKYYGISYRIIEVKK